MSVDDFWEGTEFELDIDRHEFEASWAALYPRLVAPIEKALKIANVTSADLDTVEVVGGATAIPKV
jgi:hypoxia up-regulated 1